MGPTWILLAPNGPHDGPMNLAINNILHTFYPSPFNPIIISIIKCGMKLLILFSNFNGAIWGWRCYFISYFTGDYLSLLGLKLISICKRGLWSFYHFEAKMEEMDAIFQTTNSNAFSWMKICKFWLKFCWSLFPRVQLTIFSTGSDNGLEPNRRQAIIWTNIDLIHRRIYAALGGDELI